MATKRQFGWQKLFLILTVLTCCRSLEVSIPEPQYEIAKGGDISLPCNFVPARPVTNKFVLTWEVFPENEGETLRAVATYFINTPVDIAPAYENRVSLDVDVNNQQSLLHLTKVTMEDSRRYQCSVLIPNDDEGTTAASTSLLVLEPPSPPICEIKGTAEYWQNITLTCVSKEGSPLPVYEWTTYNSDNVQRQFPPKTTEKNGALSLVNISRETSGFFICTSTNRIGSASCNLTLAVMPNSMNMGSTALIVIGVIAGVLVLGVIGFCVYRKKCKKEKNPEGSPEEMAYYDKDAPEAEQYWDDKSTSKTKEFHDDADEDVKPQTNYSVGTSGQKFDDDQSSYHSGTDRFEGKGSEASSQRYQSNKSDHYRGSRDRLDDQRDDYRGSRDRLDDQRDDYRGSRDRLDDQRDRSRGSRDRLDDQRDDYRGSRDRLDDQRDRYGGSRDRYGGSRDRLDDQRDHYRGSRDRLDDQQDRYGGSRDRYGGSRDRLDDQRDHYRGSRDRLDDQRDRYGGSRDRLDDDRYRNRSDLPM